MRNQPFLLTKQRLPPKHRAKCNSFAMDAVAAPEWAAFDAEAVLFFAVAEDHGCTWAFVADQKSTVRLVYVGSIAAICGVSTLGQIATITGVMVDGISEDIIEDIVVTEDIVIIEVGGDQS